MFLNIIRADKMTLATTRYFHSGGDTIKVAKKDDCSEMSIMLFPSTRLPPTFVRRVFRKFISFLFLLK